MKPAHPQATSPLMDVDPKPPLQVSEDQARAREAASRVTEDAERVACELRALDAEVAAATARRAELQGHSETLKVRVGACFSVCV